ncbi:MAG: 4Fe-4S binding protein [Desulfovibrio sp.]|jgi:L-aspartate semialdehyde sulfurtransferase ferredoxin|nr:4Fe-4S binding protein [Desulfovibrio sp.]MBI4959433.1 4Fe-4S binding protein [Desulfovibrio sp.]
MNEVRKIVHLSFSPETSGKPVVCNIIKLFDLCFNILKAQINPREVGEMVLEIHGIEQAVNDGLEYLKEHGVKITPVAQKVRKDEDLCVHCGVCTALCRPRALEIDRKTWRVHLDSEKCVACGLCVKLCPVKAMETQLENGVL